MASKDSSVKQTLECTVCLNTFDDVVKVPKFLSCGHTFCVECLGKMMTDQTISCPKCRRSNAIPSGIVINLPTNYSMLDLLESTCQECMDKSQQGKCDHCEKMVCSSCREDHLELFRKDLGAVVKQTTDVIRELDAKAQNSSKEIQTQYDCGVGAVQAAYSKALSDLQQKRKEILESVRKKRDCISSCNLEWEKQSQIEIFTNDLKKLGKQISKPMTGEEIVNVGDCIKKLKANVESVVEKQPLWEESFNKTAVETLASVSDTINKPLKIEDSKENEIITANIPNIPTIVTNEFWRYQSTLKVILKKIAFGPQDEYGPWGIAVSKETNRIFVSDQGNYQILVLDDQLNMQSEFGNPGKGNKQFNLPRGLAFDSLDRLLIADFENDRIQCVNNLGRFRYKFGCHGASPGQFNGPAGLHIDENNRLFVCDRLNHSVQIFDLNAGEFLLKFGDSTRFKGHIHSLTTTQDGRILVSELEGPLHFFKSKGEWIKTIHGSRDGHFSKPRGIIVNNNNHIVLADSANNCVVILSTDGEHCLHKIDYQTPQERAKYRSDAIVNGVALMPNGDLLVSALADGSVTKFEVSYQP